MEGWKLIVLLLPFVVTLVCGEDAATSDQGLVLSDRKNVEVAGSFNQGENVSFSGRIQYNTINTTITKFHYGQLQTLMKNGEIQIIGRNVDVSIIGELVIAVLNPGELEDTESDKMPFAMDMTVPHTFTSLSIIPTIDVKECRSEISNSKFRFLKFSDIIKTGFIFPTAQKYFEVLMKRQFQLVLCQRMEKEAAMGFGSDLVSSLAGDDIKAMMSMVMAG